MGQTEPTITYLPDEDILSVELGPARPAITIEIGDGGLVRIDMETHEVIAFEVLNFRERLEAGSLPGPATNGDKPHIPQGIVAGAR